MTDCVPALKSLRPGAAWSLVGDGLDGLVWPEQQQTRPTNEEIATEAARLAALPPADPAPAEKLAAAGLTVADLKSLLGLPA